jgi:histidinol-phosphate/aromatic aminotransferase/cobyric acid decarboxylase-like protein
LQILNKYKKVYANACKKIAENRKDFYNELTKFNFLRPIKSQANYIMCEVLKPYGSDDLCKKLAQMNFLIKDCQNKMGFDGKQYVRIAVKSKEDNMKFIETLKTI